MRAMILAAGKGNRMRPLTDTIPKPLLRINNKALIIYTIEALVQAGIQEIVINLGHLGEKIKSTLGTGSAWGVCIEYSYEDPILETAGGIKKALPMLGECFIAVSADIFTDFDFSMLETMRDLNYLVLTPNPAHHPTGDYGFLGASAILSDTVEPRYNFAGIGLYQSTLFEACPVGRYTLGALFKQAIMKGQLSGGIYKGVWYNIGTPEQLETVNQLCLVK